MLVELEVLQNGLVANKHIHDKVLTAGTLRTCGPSGSCPIINMKNGGVSMIKPTASSCIAVQRSTLHHIPNPSLKTVRIVVQRCYYVMKIFKSREKIMFAKWGR